jgi:hypothetical protein
MLCCILVAPAASLILATLTKAPSRHPGVRVLSVLVAATIAAFLGLAVAGQHVVLFCAD